jgi:hypothetical protein
MQLKTIKIKTIVVGNLFLKLLGVKRWDLSGTPGRDVEELSLLISMRHEDWSTIRTPVREVLCKKKIGPTPPTPPTALDSPG